MIARLFAGALFGAAALICLGLFVALAEETYAVITLRIPTISQTTAQAIQGHPHVALFFGVVFGMVVGGLATHFTNWRST